VNVSEAKVVCPTVSRVTSIRQRSRSGDSSPVCQSQIDIVASGSVGMATASGAVSNGSGMIRSSSDSNILLDTDKHKGQSVSLT